ncbi:MAG: hypothetical protein HN350_13940 [Phycisphaerales bacterium]|jgi:general secretion pathway protein G|nr:hypothetical protein [Phycisphaerales bacterium]
MKLDKTASILVKLLVVTAIAVGVRFAFRVQGLPAETCACEPHWQRLFSIIDMNVEASVDARLSNLTTNLQSIRAQLELYRLHHNGKYPTDITDGLTRKSNSEGEIDPSGVYGPYMCSFPPNPFIDDEEKATKTDGADGEGWSYNPKTGMFCANSPEHKDL